MDDSDYLQILQLRWALFYYLDDDSFIVSFCRENDPMRREGMSSSDERQ